MSGLSLLLLSAYAAAYRSLSLRRQFPQLEVCTGDTAPEYTVVSQFLTDARANPPTLIESKHVVALAPRTLGPGGWGTGEAAVSAAMFVKLPQAPVEGGSGFEVALTKVVLVGTDHASGDGVYFPQCGFKDQAASDWLKQASAAMVDGPALLAPSHSDALALQVPFLRLLLGARFHDNVLPIVLGAPSAEIGQKVGDLLTSLVEEGGIYQHERVLFLFAADLSHNLEKKWATPRDLETTAKITSQGFGPLLNYFNKLRDVAVGDESRRPYDFGGVLGAVKLASNLGLIGAKVRVANSGDFIGLVDRNENDIVRGYASIVFTKDTRTAGEIASGEPAEQTIPPTSTTTTTAPATVAPPTLEPAPFGATNPNVLLSRVARLRAAGADFL